MGPGRRMVFLAYLVRIGSENMGINMIQATDISLGE
jgi:hypothetical protein